MTVKVSNKDSFRRKTNQFSVNYRCKVAFCRMNDENIRAFEKNEVFEKNIKLSV